MAHTLPNLPYEFNALEPIIDARTMKIHHNKHHAGYVTKLNAALEKYPELKDKTVDELLANIDSVPEDIKKTVINNGGGHSNHSLFWQVMGSQAKSESPSEKLLAAMVNAFGSGEECHKRFVEVATTRFGSGWGWLVVNKNKKLEILSTPNQDSPLMDDKIPILGIDVWEHAYYLNYQNKRPDYIEAWTKLINWKKVDELYEKALA